MSEVIKKYTAEETARMRDEQIKKQFEPLMAKVFQMHPEIRSAVMLVAQFWNDEAEDAVHYDLVFSKLPEPDMRAVASLVDAGEEEDPINLPEGMTQADVLDWNDRALIHWDSNSEAIPLFAAFTKEDCHQEMSFAEMGAPYAFFVRTPDGVQTRVVAQMLRPWLDGVKPVEDVQDPWAT